MAQTTAPMTAARFMHLQNGNDRGVAVAALDEGAAAVFGSLLSEGKSDGVRAHGGSRGRASASRAARTLPVGLLTAGR